MTDLAALRRKAAEMAYGLGIALYVGTDGRISQFGPGDRIDPAPGARPTEHGHTLRAQAQTQP